MAIILLSIDLSYFIFVAALNNLIIIALKSVARNPNTIAGVGFIQYFPDHSCMT